MNLVVAVMEMVDKDIDAKYLEDHITYLNAHIKDKNIYAKGPFLDHSGGLIIFNTDSLDRAKKIMDNDPCIKSGARKYILKEWRSNLEK